LNEIIDKKAGPTIEITTNKPAGLHDK